MSLRCLARAVHSEPSLAAGRRSTHLATVYNQMEKKMLTQSVSDEHLHSMLDEQRLWLLRGMMQASPVYGLRSALIAAFNNIAAGHPVLSLALSPVDEIIVEGDQMYRLWRYVGLV